MIRPRVALAALVALVGCSTGEAPDRSDDDEGRTATAGTATQPATQPATRPSAATQRATATQPAADGPAAVGTAAPDFTLATASGERWTLSEQRGQPVALVFFRGTW